MFRRWLGVSGLVFAGWVAYAGLLGLVMSWIAPAYVEGEIGRSPGIPPWAWVLFHSALVGAAVGVFIGPLFSVAVVRSTNRLIGDPRDELRWWSRARKMALLSFAAVAAGAAVGAVLCMFANPFTDYNIEGRAVAACKGLVYGSGLAAVATFLIPFLGGIEEETPE